MCFKIAEPKPLFFLILHFILNFLIFHIDNPKWKLTKIRGMREMFFWIMKQFLIVATKNLYRCRFNEVNPCIHWLIIAPKVFRKKYFPVWINDVKYWTWKKLSLSPIYYLFSSAFSKNIYKWCFEKYQYKKVKWY